MNSIFTRRSIRTFTPQPIEPEKIDRLLRAAMQAPSANNTRPWEFIVVKDLATREKVAALNPYAKAAIQCDTCIIVLANMEKSVTGGFYWAQNIAICTQNILLQAVEEGLGGVWLGYYPREERVAGLSDIFNLPDHIIPYAVIALGYPDRGTNHFIDRYDESVIHYEAYTPNTAE